MYACFTCLLGVIVFSSSAETEAQSSFGADSPRRAIETAFKQLSGRFDEENGGFSSAPKFPRVSEINLVLLQHLISTDRQQKSDAGESKIAVDVADCLVVLS